MQIVLTLTRVMDSSHIKVISQKSHLELYLRSPFSKVPECWCMFVNYVSQWSFQNIYFYKIDKFLPWISSDIFCPGDNNIICLVVYNFVIFSSFYDQLLVEGCGLFWAMITNLWDLRLSSYCYVIMGRPLKFNLVFWAIIFPNRSRSSKWSQKKKTCVMKIKQTVSNW